MSSRALAGLGVLAAIAAAAPACAALGVVDDGSSLSWGRANGGRLVGPARLPDEGDGYRVPARWRDRGLRYGTDELVGMIVAVSRRVALEAPGARLTVADLSPERGGRSAWHRSHQSGRDVDLVFFVTDQGGRPFDLEEMRRFGPDGTTVDDARVQGPRLLFDVERNWLLVRAIVEHAGAEVQRVFLYEPLAQLLLDHARAIGEPEAVVARARALMAQPGDSAPHDDHFHVRILCSPEDRALGCTDYGLPPLDKKAPKEGEGGWAGLPPPYRQMLLAPMPAMLALVGLPILR